MFRHLHARSWVTLSNVIAVEDSAALCNIFVTGHSIVVPVVLGRRDSVIVRIAHCDSLFAGTGIRYEIWYPGETEPIVRTTRVEHNALVVRLELRRGCAFVVLAAG
jgi:hypothetical protein